MTDTKSDAAQETNGEDQEELTIQLPWERYGMSRDDYSDASEESSHRMGRWSTYHTYQTEPIYIPFRFLLNVLFTK